jgi:acetyl-CoA carboxylase biotin carboxyl carrier protein
MANGKGSEGKSGRGKSASEFVGEEALRDSAIHPDTLKQIVAILDSSDVTRLDWKRGDERLIIRRGPETPVASATQHTVVHTPMTVPAPAQVSVPVSIPAPTLSPAPAVSLMPAAPANAHAAANAVAEKKPGTVVTSPFVGTFYRAPSPDAPSFVEVGQVVRKGQVLCIIEAMKLMNEIEADAPGKIAESLCENGQTVEFGQPLFRIEPV